MVPCLGYTCRILWIVELEASTLERMNCVHVQYVKKIKQTSMTTGIQGLQEKFLQGGTRLHGGPGDMLIFLNKLKIV